MAGTDVFVVGPPPEATDGVGLLLTANPARDFSQWLALVEATFPAVTAARLSSAAAR